MAKLSIYSLRVEIPQRWHRRRIRWRFFAEGLRRDPYAWRRGIRSLPIVAKCRVICHLKEKIKPGSTVIMWNQQEWLIDRTRWSYYQRHEIHFRLGPFEAWVNPSRVARHKPLLLAISYRCFGKFKCLELAGQEISDTDWTGRSLSAIRPSKAITGGGVGRIKTTIGLHS